MRVMIIGLLVVTVLADAAAFAGNVSTFAVTFQTTECNGDTGMGSANVDRIFKIQVLDCGVAGERGRKLKQVLVRTGVRANAYEVFTVTDAEAKKIQTQIERYMGARQKAIEGGKTVIIEH